jgi:NADPH:quinone reductase-like Zn-dependent oxidoreductase
MRVAGITARGEPVEDELAPPGADEVLLDVAAAGIGNWDELVRIGSWQLGGPAPMALGTEAAGTVAAAGSRVADVGEGDEVITHPLPLRRHGTWTARVLAPAATVVPRPPEASWEAGGAFPIPALTAAQALDEALGIESGGWVVVNGAGGVTGGLLVQLAAARGARVIATASARKAGRVRGYGASEVLDYHGDWPALVREITGGGAPKAVNAARRAGGHHIEGCCRQRPPRHDHGRPAAGGTGRRLIRRLRPTRRSAAVGPRGAAGPRRA